MRDPNMKGSDMLCLNDTPCRIEDRRVPSSLDKLSSVFELRCEDCGNHFLIVVAVADATDYTSVCRKCWSTRSILSVCGVGKSDKEVKLGPGEDVLDLLNQRFQQYNKAMLCHDGATRSWFLGVDGRWKEQATCEDCCSETKGCETCQYFQDICGDGWVCASFKLPEGCTRGQAEQVKRL